jgi:hypothetical protein
MADPTTQFTIPPRTIGIDATQVVRGFAHVEVRITGYDNTYTAGAMSFTFYDTGGRLIGDGAVRADFTSAFRAFYTSARAGSAFQVGVTFPVAGDASQVASVEVELTNAAGTVRTARLAFQ